ncbi:MAG: hypothetical protein SGILL_004935, partial [Bacillariaceae sp.]
ILIEAKGVKVSLAYSNGAEALKTFTWCGQVLPERFAEQINDRARSMKQDWMVLPPGASGSETGRGVLEAYRDESGSTIDIVHRGDNVEGNCAKMAILEALLQCGYEKEVLDDVKLKFSNSETANPRYHNDLMMALQTVEGIITERVDFDRERPLEDDDLFAIAFMSKKHAIVFRNDMILDPNEETVLSKTAANIDKLVSTKEEKQAANPALQNKPCAAERTSTAAAAEKPAADSAESDRGQNGSHDSTTAWHYHFNTMQRLGGGGRVFTETREHPQGSLPFSRKEFKYSDAPTSGTEEGK